MAAAGSIRLPHPVGEYLFAPIPTARKAILWLNGCWQLRRCTHVGRWVQVSGRVRILNQGRIIIGDRVKLHAHHLPSIFTVFRGAMLEIGERTVINYGADICASGLVSIGSDCLIGTNCIVLDSNFHELENRDLVPAPKPVIIEGNVWIGNRAMVLPGVTIGEGAVVGAGSVVMTDIPARTLAIGNPARVVQRIGTQE
jgi:acetyltransferase-like isoleucine patch superfamily enzyme